MSKIALAILLVVAVVATSEAAPQIKLRMCSPMDYMMMRCKHPNNKLTRHALLQYVLCINWIFLFLGNVKTTTTKKPATTTTKATTKATTTTTTTTTGEIKWTIPL